MNTSYRIGWILFRAVFRGYFGCRVYHPERVPREGPVILASNHASFIDPPLVGSGLDREINYLARETLFNQRLFGALLRSWNAVPVDRDGTSPRGLRNILDRLRKGGGIILFPEGTRSPDGNLQPARSGVGLVVAKTTAPVVPVRVFGTFEAYGRQMKVPRPRPVAVKYGHPMDMTELRVEAKRCPKDRLKRVYQEIADEIVGEIAKLTPSLDVTEFRV